MILKWLLQSILENPTSLTFKFYAENQGSFYARNGSQIFLESNLIVLNKHTLNSIDLVYEKMDWLQIEHI